MFNVLLEELPDNWNGYPISTDFRTGIKIMQCLHDTEYNISERMLCALCMLFPYEDKRPDMDEAQKALQWFMTEFNHDRHKKKENEKKSFDFDIDQWRIYAAFLQQYGIDLNTADMHWFVFMGLFSNLDECAFTRVVDIRTKKINAKDSREVRKAVQDAKETYRIDVSETSELTTEEKARDEAALEVFNKLRNKK